MKRRSFIPEAMSAGLALLGGAYWGLRPEPAPKPAPAEGSRAPAALEAPTEKPTAPAKQPVNPAPLLRSESTRETAAFEEPAPPDPLDIEKPMPELTRIADSLERAAEDPGRLAGKLDAALRCIDWRDPAQARAMSGIIQDVVGRHPSSLDLIEAYVEREAQTHALHFSEDPRPTRSLVELYLAIVPGAERRRSFVLGMAKEDPDASSRDYYDQLYFRITGHALPPGSVPSEPPAP